MIYFGTDGIRGTVGQEITQEIAFKCGNALAGLGKKLKIVVATDTRTSADFLFTSFASGATMAGATIIFVGVAPTPVVSFLKRKIKADFGVMIPESHNPPEDNGIKIFNREGEKIDIHTQTLIEKGFAKQKFCKPLGLGKIIYKPILLEKYIKFVTQTSGNLKGLKVVLDLSNGASVQTAPKIFNQLGADVVIINTSQNGKVVNKNCGALHPEGLAKEVVRQNADIGFAFDGDADRVVMVDEHGTVCNGDQILLFLANMYKKFNLLKTSQVVGTILSNFALDVELKKLGLEFIRTDVGDHNVEKELCAKKLQLGGEQAGHIILFDYERTGDGVFCATQICQFLKHIKTQKAKPKQETSQQIELSKTKNVQGTTQISKMGISNYIFKDFVPQHSKNVCTERKFEVVNSKEYKDATKKCEQLLRGKGRIVTRASGTENLVRIMVESKDSRIASNIIQKLEAVINQF